MSLDELAHSRVAPEKPASRPLPLGETAGCGRGLDPELGCDDDAVPTPPREASQFTLGGSKAIHTCHVKVSNPLLERLGEQTLASVRGRVAHQSRAAEANPCARDARR